MCEAQIIEPTSFGMVLVSGGKPIARAKKAGRGFGWSVASYTVSPWTSTRTGKPTAYLAVKSKADARRALRLFASSLATSCGAQS